MAVPEEQFSPDQLARNGINVRLTGIRRAPSGAWMADIEAHGEAALPDGRVIDVRKIVATRMNQQRGRRGGRHNPIPA